MNPDQTPLPDLPDDHQRTGLRPVARRRKVPGRRRFGVAGRARRRLGWIVTLGLLALILPVAAGVAWYSVMTSPVGGATQARVVIPHGASPDVVADRLVQAGVVRSKLAFIAYMRLHQPGTLQAGTYHLSTDQSLQQIVHQLVDGMATTFTVQFLPGATQAQSRQAMIKAGLEATAVDQALAADYPEFRDSLFAGKPAGTDYEGYLYGQTYQFNEGTPPQEVLRVAFRTMWQAIESAKLPELYQARGLTLYQGITLASIVQREVTAPDPNRPTDDQRQVAQVFYLRLARDISLGSDVTYQYVADKTGVQRRVDLDTPYNTRRYKGLPPGPIAAPGLGALVATATPAAGDYLFFLSGDDNVTYFARTDKEHEANIRQHCRQKCQII